MTGDETTLQIAEFQDGSHLCLWAVFHLGHLWRAGIGVDYDDAKKEGKKAMKQLLNPKKGIVKPKKRDDPEKDNWDSIDLAKRLSSPEDS